MKLAGLELKIGDKRMHKLAKDGAAILFNFGYSPDYLAQIDKLTYIKQGPGLGEEPCYLLLNPEKHLMEAKR